MTRPAVEGFAVLTRHAEDHEDEERREDDLGDERAAGTDVDVTRRAPSVGAQPGGRAVIERRRREHAPQRQRAHEATDELGDPVAQPASRSEIRPATSAPSVTAGLT